MNILINIFAIIGFIVTLCSLAGYFGYKIMMWLDERK
jgi:hypothetical protein